MKWWLIFSLFGTILLACNEHVAKPYVAYITKNIVVVVVDGPRYTETWGDPNHANIPVRDSLLQYGVLVNSFYNQGPTFTNPGHSAITTGNYESIANDGSQYPSHPSILQVFIKSAKALASSCWLITSKDKLHILSNSTASDYWNQYICSIDCGINGNGTGGYREDSITFQHVLATLSTQQPRIMVVNFRGPDSAGHLGDSLGYIAAIHQTDYYIGQIWKTLQESSFYSDKTTLMVTNDHGRHTDGIADGYKSHGDACEGCRHIEFFALSPDFKQNTVLTTSYEQIDISSTMAELLHLNFFTGHGKIMKALMK
jgi:predicted AlkP superfamily pyrophosphatase or phosphodiesterase